jgi:biopolymer transport protein ExbB
MGQIRENIKNGRIDNKNSSPFKISVARLIEKGISRIGKPLEDQYGNENAGKLEIYKLEKNVSMLATISGAG